MYQNFIRRQLRAAAIAVGALALGATVAGADTVDCQRAIVKGAQKYASARIKALQKCEEGRLTGKITTACSVDAKTQDKITKADAKLQDGITSKCSSVTVGDLGFDSLVNRCVGGPVRRRLLHHRGASPPGQCVGGTEERRVLYEATATVRAAPARTPTGGTCGDGDALPGLPEQQAGRDLRDSADVADRRRHVPHLHLGAQDRRRDRHVLRLAAAREHEQGRPEVPEGHRQAHRQVLRRGREGAVEVPGRAHQGSDQDADVPGREGHRQDHQGGEQARRRHRQDLRRRGHDQRRRPPEPDPR